jgi:hypothetical protein
LFYHGGGASGQHYDVMFVQTEAQSLMKSNWKDFVDIARKAATVVYNPDDRITLRNLRSNPTARNPQGRDLQGKSGRVERVNFYDDWAGNMYLTYDVYVYEFDRYRDSTRMLAEWGVQYPYITITDNNIDNDCISNEQTDALGQTRPLGWASDKTERCMVCNEQFGAFRWRHHCRMCGGIVCASPSCSQKRRYSGYNCQTCLKLREDYQLAWARGHNLSDPPDILRGQLAERLRSLGERAGSYSSASVIQRHQAWQQPEQQRPSQLARDFKEAGDQSGVAVSIANQNLFGEAGVSFGGRTFSCLGL